MLREKFLDAIDEFENYEITITTYYNGEIISRYKIVDTSVEEYDDEIIIHGNKNDFVVLNCQDINKEIGEDNVIEYLFGTGEFNIGVEFAA